MKKVVSCVQSRVVVMVVVYLQAAPYSSRTSMGENEYGSCACVRELYVIDEIEKGVSIFLGLFTDDSVMSL
jgi:hypothetical protein